MSVGSASETITVKAGAPLVNTESGTVSTLIDQTFVENLPLNGRSFQTLIMLTPGVVVTATAFDDQGQFSVNGQRADANYFTFGWGQRLQCTTNQIPAAAVAWLAGVGIVYLLPLD